MADPTSSSPADNDNDNGADRDAQLRAVWESFSAMESDLHALRAGFGAFATVVEALNTKATLVGVRCAQLHVDLWKLSGERHEEGAAPPPAERGKET